MFLHPL